MFVLTRQHSNWQQRANTQKAVKNKEFAKEFHILLEYILKYFCVNQANPQTLPQDTGISLIVVARCIVWIVPVSEPQWSYSKSLKTVKNFVDTVNALTR
jgi:hypothetical protein